MTGGLRNGARFFNRNQWAVELDGILGGRGFTGGRLALIWGMDFMKCLVPGLAVWMLIGCAGPEQKRSSHWRSYDYAISDQTGMIAPEMVATVERAALSGDSEGSIRLYHHYSHAGQEKEALRWARLGAVQGNTAAMMGLAGDLERGHAAEREEAQCWRRIAYHLGNPAVRELYHDTFSREDLSRRTALIKD